MIQGLDKTEIKFFRLLLISEYRRAKLLPQQPKRGIRHTVFPLFLIVPVVVKRASSDIKDDPGKILWHLIAASHEKSRMDHAKQRIGKHIIRMKFSSVCEYAVGLP